MKIEEEIKDILPAIILNYGMTLQPSAIGVASAVKLPPVLPRP